MGTDTRALAVDREHLAQLSRSPLLEELAQQRVAQAEGGDLLVLLQSLHATVPGAPAPQALERDLDRNVEMNHDIRRRRGLGKAYQLVG